MCVRRGRRRSRGKDIDVWSSGIAWARSNRSHIVWTWAVLEYVVLDRLRSRSLRLISSLGT